MNGEDTEQVVETTESSVSVPSEVEEKARRMGWTDQDEFKGHPDRWVDAETYVKKADEHLPILRGTLATMEKKMVAQETLIREQNQKLAAVQSDIKEFVGYTRQAEERAYKKALEQLKAEQRSAVEEQDLVKFDTVSDEIDKHIKSYSAGKPSEAETSDQTKGASAESWAQPGVYEAWMKENDWYRESPKMAAFAIQMDKWLYDTKPSQTQKERLADITRLVQEEFPEHWANPKRSVAPTVESGEGNSANLGPKGKRTYGNLPPEARAACDKFSGKDGKGKTGTIPGYTRDDYVKDYGWEE